MKDKKVILWDFDGTLGFRKDGMWGASMISALKEHDPSTTLVEQQFRPFLMTGFPWHHPEHPHIHIQSSDDWWKPIINKFCEGYMHFGYSKKISVLLAQRAREIFINLDRWAVYDDTFETLGELSNYGWKHIILSNHIPELGKIVEHLGLNRYIDIVVNSAEVGYEKPNKEIYYYTIKCAENPNRVWMIGDNVEADVLGAQSVGIKGILVRNDDNRAKWKSVDLKGVIEIIESEGICSEDSNIT
jgi:putative hydrolase of the HAD superfamily